VLKVFKSTIEKIMSHQLQLVQFEICFASELLTALLRTSMTFCRVFCILREILRI